jgi:hypothetical protein
VTQKSLKPAPKVKAASKKPAKRTAKVKGKLEEKGNLYNFSVTVNLILNSMLLPPQ